MDLSSWELTSVGDVKCNPAIRWQVAPGKKGLNGLVRIEFATEPSLSRTAAVQLNFGPSQIKDFISDLTRLAAIMDQNLASPAN